MELMILIEKHLKSISFPGFEFAALQLFRNSSLVLGASDSTLKIKVT